MVWGIRMIKIPCLNVWKRKKLSTMKYYLFDNHKNSVYNIWKTLNPIINPEKGKSFTTINELIIDQGVVVDK